MKIGESLKTLEGMAFVGGIGAGILSLPYAIAKVGLPLGIPYIIGVGILMMVVNLLIAEVMVKTRTRVQLAGLATRYLGKLGGFFMAFLSYALLLSALLIYIIGEGKALSALFSGSEFWWSVGFFAVASFFVSLGMKTVKKIDVFLLFFLTLIIGILVYFGFSHLETSFLTYTDTEYIFFPYGILMFAFHSCASVPEAYEVAEKNSKILKRIIVWSTLYCIVVYSFFAIATVGVMGSETTEIATIGLGQKIGSGILIFANVFAALAMGLSFLNLGSAFRDSLQWDFGFSPRVGSLFACFIPFILFLAGVRGFIQLIDLVGGVLISLEMFLLLFIYWKMEKNSPKKRSVMIHYTVWIFIFLLLAFSLGTVYSVFRIV